MFFGTMPHSPIERYFPMKTTQPIVCATLAVLVVGLSLATAHGQYVTRDEFNALRGQVNNLEDQVSQLVSLQRETLHALRGSRPSTPVRYASNSGPPVRYVSDEPADPSPDHGRSSVARTETTIVIKIRIRISDSRGRPSAYDSGGYGPPASDAGRANDDVPVRAASYQRPLPTARYGHWQSPSGYRYGS